MSKKKIYVSSEASPSTSVNRVPIVVFDDNDVDDDNDDNDRVYRRTRRGDER